MLIWWFERAGDHVYDYSNWIGSSAIRRHRLVGNATVGARWLDGMVRVWDGVKDTGYPGRYLDNRTAGRAPCWWQVDDRDGMEFSISGSGCRPTINAIMFGEARAIAELATMLGNRTIANRFEAWTALSRRATLDLWNADIDSFAVVPLPPPQQRPAAALPGGFVQRPGCNLTSVRTLNATVAVRELLGFSPWYAANLPYLL